jgi:hypothetical protein
MAGQSPRPAIRWHVGTVLLALVPIASCGLLGFVPAAWLAGYRRTAGSWLGLAGFSALTCAEIVVAELYPTPRTPPTAVFLPLVLGASLGALAHYLTSMIRWQHETRRAPAAVLPPGAMPAAMPVPSPPPYYGLPAVPPAAPATDDVGEELRRLSQRLRGPQ